MSSSRSLPAWRLLADEQTATHVPVRGREVVSSSLTLILDAGGQAEGHLAR